MGGEQTFHVCFSSDGTVPCHAFEDRRLDFCREGPRGRSEHRASSLPELRAQTLATTQHTPSGITRFLTRDADPAILRLKSR